jgi:hypothetical protein
MDHEKELERLLQEAARRHSAWQVFSDFLALCAISISNALDRSQSAQREQDYLAAIRRYDRHEADLFPRMLGQLTLALEDDISDVLGRLFSSLELGNKWTGQFFTPDSVCRLMAAMSFDDTAKAIIASRGFIRASEPAVGGGAMVIALAREMLAQGINYQQHLHVTAVDTDIRAVHMAYVQLSLLHVPAVIVHGNTLTLEEHSHWYTPGHILGGWRWKLLRRQDESGSHAIVPACLPANAQHADQGTETGASQLSLF